MEVNPNFSENAKRDFLLVHDALNGKQKAFTTLMQLYKDAIFFMVLKMVNNRDDAMDITVSTFGKAFENLDKYKSNFAFSTWLFKIATNNSIDFIRKQKFKTVSIDEFNDDQERVWEFKSDNLNPEENSIKNQEKKALKNVVENLPEKYRNLVILRYFEELSYEEIAIELDIPLGTVKARLFRARDLLAVIVKNKKKISEDEF